MLTYDEARALLDAKTRKIEDGVALRHARKCRIFWRDTPKHGEKGKGDIEVYIFSRYSGGRGPAAKRAVAEEEWAKGIAFGSSKLCRIQTNGNYLIYSSTSRFDSRGSNVLPEKVEYTGSVILPDAGPPPKLTKVPDVPWPRWVPEKYDGLLDYGDWADSEDNHAKMRAEFERNIKRYGSLERWFMAYDRARLMRERNEMRLAEWRGEVRKSYRHKGRRYVYYEGPGGRRNRSDKTTQAFPGAVITPLGQLTRASWEPERKRQAAVAREQAKADRAARLEREKAEREWKKALKSANADKIFSKLSEDVRHFLTTWKLVPNSDGTVRMTKVVGHDLCSFHGDPPVKYEIGTKVVDPRYNPKQRSACGGGLHFCPTVELSYRYFGFRRHGLKKDTDRSLVVNVDLGTMRVVDGTKVVAQWCYVVCEGDENTPLGEQKPEPKKKMTEADKKRIAQTKAADREAIEAVRPKRSDNDPAKLSKPEFRPTEREGSIAGDIDIAAARKLTRS
jgi:hypothetical protein